MKKIMLLALSIILMSKMGWCFEKKDLEVSIRKSLNLTTKQKIVIGDAKPSEFAGLKVVEVGIDNGQYPIYMAPDDKQYFWGQIFNLAVDPDKVRAEKISFTKVHAHGSEKAPVTVVEFTDLQCPYCKKAHASIKESLYKDFTKDQVRLVFKNFPLSMHEWAEKAAVASECAALQKESFFWDATTYYYDQQENLKLANFDEKTAKLVTDLKLDKTVFNICVGDKLMKDKVAADRNEGTAVGVSGTPTFIVNGRMLRGTAYEDLKLLIQEKLQEGK